VIDVRTSEARWLRVAALAIVMIGLVVIAPSRARAQGSATSHQRDFARIQNRLRTGDRLLVTSKAGDVLAVRLESVDVARDLLLVSLNGIPLDLPAGGIRKIELSRRDPLTNGAWIGAAHALGVTLLLAAISDDAPAGGEFLAFSLLTVPLGAGIGAAIDATHWQREVVYRDGFPGVWRTPGAVQTVSGRRFGLSVRFAW
jgi:hypothetical protein